jgi:NAD(P)-dependent dehydrogenase (short-subunit alcohol dehydrogenase family)
MPTPPAPSNRFAGRAVVITGAASGIGRATAVRIASEGGRVFALDIADAGGAATAAAIEAAGGRAEAIEADVTDQAQVDSAIAQCAALGGFDVVVNCAGTAFYGRIGDVSVEQVDNVMDVNFYGTYRVTQAAMTTLLERRGAIVNVASVAALRGVAYLSAYSATKGAVLGFSRALAVELGGRHVRVNCVCPGPADTPLADRLVLPLGADAGLVTRSTNLYGRLATADEVAAAIAFLASPDAAHITGTVLTVDAGLSA